MTSYREILEREAQLIITPSTGSMRPMLRENRDSVLLEPFRGDLHPGDVALFYRDEDIVLHRAIHPIEGGWFTRGDHSVNGEHIQADRFIGVMSGFYRDERFIPATDPRYRLYAWAIVRLHPFLVRFWPVWTRVRRMLKSAGIRK